MTQDKYEESLRRLFEDIPKFHRDGKAAVKTDLTNIRKLCTSLDLMDLPYRIIHVAGSNGKGSVCHLLSSLLQAHEVRVGLYTSPHYIDFRERIKVNGSPCSREFVVNFMLRHQELIGEIRPSFFEISVAMSLEWFRIQDVEWAVIETGLGGRLDSTNIVDSEIQVFTSISLEHTEYLGDSIEKIAFEKAGIIKQASSVLVSQGIDIAARDVIRIKAEEMNSSYFLSSDFVIESEWNSNPSRSWYSLTTVEENQFTTTMDISGDFQHSNVNTAVASFMLWLEHTNRSWNPFQVAEGLQRCREYTGFLGRWQLWSREPDIIMDGAHNPEAFRYVLDFLGKKEYDRVFLMIGFSEEKDITDFVQGIPSQVHTILARANLPRAMRIERLQEHFAEAKKEISGAFDHVKDAWQFAQSQLGPRDVLLVTGSIYLVGDLMAYLEGQAK